MSIGAGVVVAVTFQQVDNAPDTETGTERDNEGLKNGDCLFKKCHIVCSVSYTHLDVYKRQLFLRPIFPVCDTVLAAVQEVDLVKSFPVAHLHDLGLEVA